MGGFYSVPARHELQTLVEELKWARDAAYETVMWTARLPFSDFEQDYEFVAMRHPDEYPMNEGRIVSNRRIDIDVSEYDDTFTEEHVEHSTALHSYVTERGDRSAYLCGPLAR